MANTNTQTTTPPAPNSATQAQLRAFIERVERLEEEKKVLSEDITGVYQEAKSSGYDVKAMRKVIAIRKMDPQAYAELEELVDLYKHALGMI